MKNNAQVVADGQGFGSGSVCQKSVSEMGSEWSSQLPEILQSLQSLIKIVKALEDFKLKCYERLNKDKEYDDFIMNNAPCNYNLDTVLKDVRKEIVKLKRSLCLSPQCCITFRKGHYVCDNCRKWLK